MKSEAHHKTRTLWLTGVLHAFTHLYGVALLPLYLRIQQDLKLRSVEQATLLVTVMGVAYFLPSYLQGVLADRLSRKRLLAAGLAINALGFVALSFAPDYSWALASVVLAGLGGSFYHPAATALIVRLFPEARGHALGLTGIGASVGFFIGPIYCGWRVVNCGSWRSPVLEIGLAGLVAAGLFAWLADEERQAAPVRGSAKPGAAAHPPVPHRLFPTPALWGFFLAASAYYVLGDQKAGRADHSSLQYGTNTYEFKNTNTWGITFDPGINLDDSTTAYLKLGYGSTAGKGTEIFQNVIYNYDKTYGGFSYGAGVKYRLTPNLYGMVEILQTDCGSKSFIFPDGDIAFKPGSLLGTVGLGYKF